MTDKSMDFGGAPEYATQVAAFHAKQALVATRTDVTDNRLDEELSVPKERETSETSSEKDDHPKDDPVIEYFECPEDEDQSETSKATLGSKVRTLPNAAHRDGAESKGSAQAIGRSTHKDLDTSRSAMHRWLSLMERINNVFVYWMRMARIMMAIDRHPHIRCSTCVVCAS